MEQRAPTTLGAAPAAEIRQFLPRGKLTNAGKALTSGCEVTTRSLSRREVVSGLYFSAFVTAGLEEGMVSLGKAAAAPCQVMCMGAGG